MTELLTGKEIMKKEISIWFIGFGILSLLGGVIFGIIAAIQFVVPGFLDFIPFIKNRPLHVSLVVAWIFLSAVGGIYHYLPACCNSSLFSRSMARIHLITFVVTGLVVIVCYLSGIFGGREYWEFPPWLAIPVILSWILFGINYFKSVFKRKDHWPVYLWMWGTGIFFFLFTYLESLLWVFPYFRDHLIRDITVQWKSNGSLVGSWNMLVYGTAIYLMDRIKGDEAIARSKAAFMIFFLGLTNLIFNWSHHIYIVPNAIWIRYTGYLISMTELIILGKIIWDWKRTLSKGIRDFHILAVRFIVASDVWILLNLILSISISIPAINIFTHGTHITVAHAMGSTIGINTMILTASCLFLIQEITAKTFNRFQWKSISIGFWVLNSLLLLFWLSFLAAGFVKGKLVVENQLAFQEIMLRVQPWLSVAAICGTAMLVAFLMIFLPPLKLIRAYLR